MAFVLVLVAFSLVNMAAIDSMSSSYSKVEPVVTVEESKRVALFN